MMVVWCMMMVAKFIMIEVYVDGIVLYADKSARPRYYGA
jgi:hypothetical protein